MSSRPSSSARGLLAGIFLGVLTACGGGGGGDAGGAPPVSPPPPANQPPLAAFTAPTTLVAGGVADLDARASQDPEGSTLAYHWDFGDGHRGGTGRIAHVFADAGRYTVRLTVLDAQGASATLEREVVVTAPAAARTVQVNGRVLDLAGQPQASATVAVQGGGATATSDAQGRVALAVAVGREATLRVSRAGHADQVQVLRLPATTGADGWFEVRLAPRAAAQTLPDAAAGGSLAGTDGVRITLPPGALVTAGGAAVSGAVQVTMTPIDVNSAAAAAFPGRFEGLQADGTRTPIVSYGTTEFTLSQGGQPLQLRPGARATIELPLYAGGDLDGRELAAGETLPLWSLDERSGQWVNEGVGTLVASSASPTLLAMRAEVAHLSWWNADKGYQPYRPRPTCINDVPGQYDSLFEQATICKMLAEMDKPIPPQGSAARARPLAVPSERLRFPVVRIDTELPIAGGVALEVPPDTDMLLTGTALNGTWRGQVRVRGGQGVAGDVSVPLRPLAAGGDSELIVLPFDEARAAAPSRADRYRFAATAGLGVRVTASRSGSDLGGTVRLRDGTGRLLASQAFGSAPGVLETRIVDAGEATVEVEPLANAPGGYRLQVEAVEVPERVASTGLSMQGVTLPPKVATNTNGAALAVWTEMREGVELLLASRFLGPRDGWAPPEPVAEVAGLNRQVGLQVALDDAGNAIVAWSVGSGPVVSRRAAAGNWSAAQTLGSAACAGGTAQRLGVTGSGEAVLVWQRGATPGLCVRRFASGTWAAEQALATPLSASTVEAVLSLAVSSTGEALAAWTLDASAGIAAARIGADGSWGTPTVFAGSASGSAPGAALADDGRALVAWLSVSGGSFGGVQAASRTAGGAWGAPQAVGPNGGAALPRPVWLAGTRFQVVWLSTSGISSREFDAATGQWGTTLPVAPGRVGLLLDARASAGAAVAMWSVTGAAGTGNDLGFSRWDAADGAWRMSSALLDNRPVLVTQAGRVHDTAALSVAGPNAAMVWRGLTPDRQNQTLQAAQVAAGP